MKKRMIALLLTLSMSGAMVACSGGSTTTDDQAVEATTEAVDVEVDSAEDATVEEATEETADTAVEAETAGEAEEATTEATEEVAAATENEIDYANSEWINFDEMNFMVNGKTYTLGVTTLQDMIDDGVPFNENDLANAGNNLNANYMSSDFSIELAEYWNAQIYVMNDTEEGKPMSECVVAEVYMYTKDDQEQDIISFTFPLDMTEEELIAACGETEDVYHYEGENNYVSNRYTYAQESEKYYSDREYEFTFINGELENVSIEWIP